MRKTPATLLFSCRQDHHHVEVDPGRNQLWDPPASLEGPLPLCQWCGHILRWAVCPLWVLGRNSAPLGPYHVSAGEGPISLHGSTVGSTASLLPVPFLRVSFSLPGFLFLVASGPLCSFVSQWLDLTHIYWLRWGLKICPAIMMGRGTGEREIDCLRLLCKFWGSDGVEKNELVFCGVLVHMDIESKWF